MTRTWLLSLVLLTACQPAVPTPAPEVEAEGGPGEPDAGADAGSDAGSDAGAGAVLDAGPQVEPGAPADAGLPAVGDIIDPAWPPVPAPARLGFDLRPADLLHRRLALAEAPSSTGVDRAWAWVSAAPDGPRVIVVPFIGAARGPTVVLPSAGEVLHLRLAYDAELTRWAVAWVVEDGGLFTALISRDGVASTPVRLPASVMSKARPFALVFAWKRLVVVAEQQRDERELIIASVPAPDQESFEFHTPLAPLGEGLVSPGLSAVFDGSSLLVALGDEAREFSWPDRPLTRVPLQGVYFGPALVIAPHGPTHFTRWPLLLGVGDGAPTRVMRGQSVLLDFVSARARWPEGLPEETWGGGGERAQLWDHTGIAAVACGRQVVAVQRVAPVSSGRCASACCSASELQLFAQEPEQAPLPSRTLEGCPGGGCMDDLDVRQVFSPVLAVNGLNVDAAWLQAVADGGLELRVEHHAFTCAPAY